MSREYEAVYIFDAGLEDAAINDKLAKDAMGELLKSRGPFRRVWAMVEGETR